MADDRPANDDLTEVVATLKRDLDDLRSTALARAGRKPTGDIEPTIRTSAKPDTLLLQGQSVNREEYPVLWQWVQDQNLVAPGLFGNGNGSTTFVLPDMRGRVLVGAGTLGPDTLAVGALSGSSRVTLSVANMPAHNHGAADNHQHYVSPVDNHNHYFNSNPGGNHGGHYNSEVLHGGGTGWRAANPAFIWSGDHRHDGYTSNSGGHDHGYTSNSGTHTHTTQGAGEAFDARPPSIAVNWLIWC